MVSDVYLYLVSLCPKCLRKKTEAKKDFMWLTVSEDPAPQPKESTKLQQHSEHDRLGKQT